MPDLNKILKTKTAFIFDMDGTILDMENLNYSGYKETVKEFFNLELDNSKYQQYFSGSRTARGFKDFLQSNNITDYNVDKLIKAFREIKRTNLINKPESVTKLKPGIIDYLEKLKQSNKKIALATSTVKEFVDIILNYYDLVKFFDVILTAEDVTKGKPDPQIYNIAVFKLDVNKEESVVFEDSKNGILSAKKAKIFCVGIHTKGLNDRYANKADTVISDYRHIC